MAGERLTYPVASHDAAHFRAPRLLLSTSCFLCYAYVRLEHWGEALNESKLILVCNCVHRNVIPAAVKQHVLDSLKAAGRPVTVVADLCGMAASKDPILTTLTADRNPIVLACHPRAVKWLLHAVGIDPLPASLRLLNLRTEPAETILAQLGIPPSPLTPQPLTINHQPSPPPGSLGSPSLIMIAAFNAANV